MNRYIIITFLSLYLLSCHSDKDVPKLSGEVKNFKSSEMTLHKMEDGNIVETIMTDKNGKFSKDCKVVEGNYMLNVNENYIALYLKPGMNLKINVDAQNISNSLSIDGEGNKLNNYIQNKRKSIGELGKHLEMYLAMEHDNFNKKIDSIQDTFYEIASKYKKEDDNFFKSDSAETEAIMQELKTIYADGLELRKMNGLPSPTFEKYENYSGGTISLSDLKGKMVYIDVWATWCKPCVAEIPALKELESELGDKIHFVSISVDKPEEKEAWKTMVKNKEMKGYQLFAGMEEESGFEKEYKINSIPRFILLDAKGNIIRADAPRPSDPKTKDLLLNLLKNN